MVISTTLLLKSILGIAVESKKDWGITNMPTITTEGPAQGKGRVSEASQRKRGWPTPVQKWKIDNDGWIANRMYGTATLAAIEEAEWRLASLLASKPTK